MIAFFLAAWFICGIIEIYRHDEWWNRQLPAPFDRDQNYFPWHRNNWEAYVFGPIALYVGERQRNQMRR